MARVLDLGCGTGNPPVRANLSDADDVVGVDIDERSLATARQRFPQRSFRSGRGESLPFPEGSFEQVVSGVALPYMDIPETLAEIRRVLVPGGGVFFSLHPPGFTLRELWKCAPRPVATLYRLFVLLNGICFHFTGRILRMAGRTESFQTERGFRIALARAGFADVAFTRRQGRLLVEASSAIAGSPAWVRSGVERQRQTIATRLAPDPSPLGEVRS
jgi:ubiquinone/menaquinone biosynthesis C-methylase UbiE